VIFTSRPYRQEEMLTILSAVISIIALRVRSRAALELKLVALQHQLVVLHRQRPGRPQLSSLDRLLWVWLYRIWPQVIDTMVLVKPATVVDWHRRGFWAVLALAVTPSGTAQDQRRHP
jgi:putative transposase